ncbi:MAG TPA: AAA family ATPase [Verrucomicrobiae bacterium]|jgi:predicted ATPase|nr:AAA family ATPase [Verrucomicrobiae bacterium]
MHYVKLCVMELVDLSLKRVVAVNYKSIKCVQLDNLNNLALLMGRNNAGKSNCLDVFKFLSEAAVSFEQAVASRGQNLSEVVHRKRKDETIEFLFEFVPAPRKRIDFIHSLYAGNPQLAASDVSNSAFLSVLTLKIEIRQEGFSEELSTPNVAGDKPFVIFSVKGTPETLEASSGQMETLCKRCGGELPAEPIQLASKPEAIAPYRLRLGRPEGSGAFPVSHALAEAVYQQFANLEWADPLRKMPTTSPIMGDHTLSADVSNLPDVLHWLYNNKPKQFRKIEAEVSKLVPNLGRLYTPTIQNEATLGLIDDADEELVYSINQMSFGTRSLVAIVAKVILAKPGAWVCIEEPETYLHPKAQLGLFHFLREEAKGKRIYVATHSTAIAASCPLSSLFIVQRDTDRSTTITTVTPKDTLEVIEQLGVKPSFSFEADAIVFVEQADHVPIFEAWAKKFEFHIKVQFLDAEGACTLHYFANTRIALSNFVHTLVFAVFGNGSEMASLTKRAIVEQLQLPPDQVITVDFPDLEGYLLETKAIMRAFPSIDLPQPELETRLEPARTLPEQKLALSELLSQYRLGDYDSRLGARIAAAMDEIPACVRQLFEQIDASSKPYWKI